MNGKIHKPNPARTLPRSRRIFLAELAESVAAEFSPGTGRVDLEAIARAHGITISRNDYGRAFDGLLEYRNGRFHIYCNINGSCGPGDGRAQFSLAHELAHAFIPEHRAALASGRAPSHPSFCDEPRPENRVEIEADFFASRLLLPGNRIERALKEYGRHLAGILDIARVFGVSLEATLRRVVDLPESQCAMVLFRSNGNLWHRVSPALAVAGLKHIRIGNPNTIPDSATGQACRERSSDRIFGSTTTAHLWFCGIEPGSSEDLVLREESLRNRYHTLTLLTVEEGSAVVRRFTQRIEFT